MSAYTAPMLMPSKLSEKNWWYRFEKCTPAASPWLRAGVAPGPQPPCAASDGDRRVRHDLAVDHLRRPNDDGGARLVVGRVELHLHGEALVVHAVEIGLHRGAGRVARLDPLEDGVGGVIGLDRVEAGGLAVQRLVGGGEARRELVRRRTGGEQDGALRRRASGRDELGVFDPVRAHERGVDPAVLELLG